MSIEVFHVEKLAWDNGGYLFPNALPTKFKDKAKLKKRPSESNYYGGTISLMGGHWNWCKYKEQYYFLRKLRAISIKNKDPKKQRWLYALVRDNWTNNVLLNKVIIKGDVAGWKIKKDIEENLNKVSLTIENPTGIARVCFKEQKTSWRNVLSIPQNTQLIKHDFNEIFLNKRRLNKIIEKVEVINKYKTIKPYLYANRNDIFIFGQLKPTYTFSRWKTRVAELVNEAVINLVKDPTAFIGKVTHAQGQNQLRNHYCFTYEGSAIGSKDESVQINQIDLSKVTDIRRVSWQDLYTTRIDNLFTLNSALIDINITGSTEEQDEKVYKIAQRNYLPLGQDVLRGRWNVDKYLSDHWEDKNPGQKLTVNKSEDNEATFYFVDKINFFLSWYLGSKYTVNSFVKDEDFRRGAGIVNYYQHYLSPFGTQWDPEGWIPYAWELIRKARQKKVTGWHRSGITATFSPSLFTFSKWIYYGFSPRKEELSELLRDSNKWTCENLKNKLLSLTKKDTYYPEVTDEEINGERFPNMKSFDDYPSYELTTPNVFPHIPFNTTSGSKQYLWNKLDVSPNYGILLWQVSRPKEKWELFKYVGKTKTSNLQVFNGIDSDVLFELYGTKKDNVNKEWWRRIDEKHPLSKFTGQLEFARMFLDFWQLNFLHFFPSPSDRNSYEYEQSKCYFEDRLYQISELLTSTKRCETYQVLNNQTLKDLDNNPVENPWNEDNFIHYIKEVDKKINKVFLKEDLELPRPLEHGDYLISSLEYKWDNYDFSHWCTNFQDLSNLDKNSWEVQTFSLLEDFTNLNPDTKKDIDIETEIGWKDKDSAQIFVGTDLNGEIDFYTCWRYEKEHQLSNNPNQYITSVDGKISERVTYYHLRKWETKIDTLSKETGVIDILANFYSNVGGKKVIRSEDGSKFFWDVVPIREIEGNAEGNLFDLVGSDWYAFIRGKKVHLIAKPTNPDFVKPVETKTQSFIYPEDGDTNGTKFTSDGISSLKDLPIEAKANQICTLYYKGYPITIRSKFLFDGSKYDSKPIANVKGIKTEDKSTFLDYWNFSFYSAFDTIEEILKIPKEPVSGQPIQDQLAIDQARENARRIALEDEAQRYELGLNQRMVDSSQRRQKFDLSLQEFNKRLADQFSVTGVVSSGVSTAAATVVGLAASAIGGAMVGAAAGVATKGIAALTNPVTNSYISSNITNAPKNQFGIPQLGRLLPGLETQTTIQNRIFYEHEMKEKSERIAEDKRFKYQQILMNSYNIDLTHRNRQIDNAMTLNRLGHDSVKEPINDAFLNKKWREEKGLNELYMVVRYPTGEQLEQLQAYIDEFGYDVDIPNKVITLRSGMAPNVIRMRNIAGDEVSGISDILERDFLIKLLERGIKIYSMEESENKEYDYFETSIFLPKFVNYDHVIEENEHLKERVEELEQAHVLETKENQQFRRFLLTKLEDEITDIPKLEADIKELNDKWTEVQKTPEKYTDESKDLFNEVLGVLEKRLETAKDIDQKTKDKAREAEEAKKRAETLQVEKDKAEDERDKCREELNAAHNKERSLMNENQALHNNLESTIGELQKVKADNLQKQEDIKKKQERISKLSADLKKCKAQVARQTAQTARSVNCWTYCDFLKKFNDLNWDFNEMYKILFNAPLYGFSPLEFFRLDNTAVKLQAIQQTIEECEDLLDNNTSLFKFSPWNRTLREYLLKQEGAELIRRLKYSFVATWAYSWNFKKTQNEYLDRKTWNDKIKTSGFYNKKISFDYPSDKIFRSELTQIFSDDISAKKLLEEWDKNVVPFWKQSQKLYFGDSFKKAIDWMKLRFSRSVEDNNDNWQDYDKSIYYAPGFYDLNKQPYSLAVPLYSVVYFLNYYVQHFDAIYSVIAKKQSAGYLFNNRPKNGFSHGWKYGGFSNRKFFIGYVLKTIEYMGKGSGWAGSEHATEIIVFNDNVYRKFMEWLGITTQSWNEILYTMKISYKALCEKVPFEDAQAELEEQLEQAHPPEGTGLQDN